MSALRTYHRRQFSDAGKKFPRAADLYRVIRTRQIEVNGRTIQVVERVTVGAYSKPEGAVLKLHPTRGWRLL